MSSLCGGWRAIWCRLHQRKRFYDKWDEYAACVATGRSYAETGQPFPSYADWLEAR